MCRRIRREVGSSRSTPPASARAARGPEIDVAARAPSLHCPSPGCGVGLAAARSDECEGGGSCGDASGCVAREQARHHRAGGGEGHLRGAHVGAPTRHGRVGVRRAPGYTSSSFLIFCRLSLYLDFVHWPKHEKYLGGAEIVFNQGTPRASTGGGGTRNTVMDRLDESHTGAINHGHLAPVDQHEDIREFYNALCPHTLPPPRGDVPV